MFLKSILLTLFTITSFTSVNSTTIAELELEIVALNQKVDDLNIELNLKIDTEIDDFENTLDEKIDNQIDEFEDTIDDKVDEYKTKILNQVNDEYIIQRENAIEYVSDYSNMQWWYTVFPVAFFVLFCCIRTIMLYCCCCCCRPRRYKVNVNQGRPVRQTEMVEVVTR